MSNFVICLESFYHFFRIWASLRWWREARTRRTCNKIEKHKNIEARKDIFLEKSIICSTCAFLLFLGGVSGSVFCGLVAKVFRIEATSGYFSSYVAAKLGSWKLVFRPHQTLLFRVLRGWVGTCWATFANIFSRMNFESWFHYSFEALRVQP